MSKFNQRSSYQDSRSVASSQPLFRSSQSVISRSSKLSLGQRSISNQSTVGSLRQVSSPYSQSFYSLQSWTTNSNKKKKSDYSGSLTKMVLLPDEVDEITKSWCLKITTPEKESENEYMYHPSEDDNSTINSEGAISLDDAYVLQFIHEKQQDEVLFKKISDTFNEDEGLAPIKLPSVSNEIPHQSQSTKKSMQGRSKKYENSPYASLQRTKKKRSNSKKQ